MTSVFSCYSVTYRLLAFDVCWIMCILLLSSPNLFCEINDYLGCLLPCAFGSGEAICLGKFWCGTNKVHREAEP